jgi:tRNA A-37 threonylcarbamoyl transferase component Bud32/tetratricopeptide (TPR) repeat protein
MDEGQPERIGDWVVVSTLGRDLLGPFLQVQHVDEAAHRATLHVLDGVDHVGFRRLRELVVRAHGMSHPGVARIRRIGRVGRQVLVEMDRVEGRLLSEADLDASARAAVVHHVADAIAWLHRFGLGHGALRASTVVLRADGSAVLLSVGLGVLEAGDNLQEVARLDLRELGRLVLPFTEDERVEDSVEESSPSPSRREGEPGRGSGRGPRRADRSGLPRRIGPYVPVEEIGRGGMGVVYRALDPARRREVAVKILHDAEAAGPTRRARFAREIAAVAAVRHPAVVRIIDTGVDDGTPYFAMKLIVGPSLRAELIRRGRFDPREAMMLVERVARGLHVAHTQGIVHRDVKPENILLDDDVDPVLTDFGLAFGVAEDEVRLTDGGQRLGTLGYMAPEQLRGDLGAVGPATDVHALGAVLHELITGRVTPDDATRRELGRFVADVHACATATRVGDRYPSARAFADDLRLVLDGGIPAASRGAWRRWGRGPGRTLVVSAFVGLVSAAVSLGSTAWLNERMRAGEELARERASAIRLEQMRATITPLLDAGERARARDLFDAFLASERLEVSSTPARAWLWRAQGYEAWGDRSPHDAYLHVIATQRSPEQRTLALEGLVDLARQRWDWQGLLAVDAVRAAARQEADPGIRRDLDLARRDLAGAAASQASDPASHRLLARFSKAQRVRWPADLSVVVPLAEGGRGVLLYEDGEAAATLARWTAQGEQSTPIAVPVELRGLKRLLSLGALEDGTTALLGYAPADRRGYLLAVEGRQLVVRLAWTGDYCRNGALGDTDGDGRLELYAAVGPYERVLKRFVQGPQGWVEDAPALDLGPARSDVDDVIAVDLDGDKRDELVVASGAWFAYDVRRLEHTPEGFKTVARLRVGTTTALVAGPPSPDGQVVRVLKVDRYPSPVRLGTERPMGLARGLYTLAAAPEGWRTLAHADLGGELDGRTASGDFDGDGRIDLAVGVRSPFDESLSVLVLVRRKDGTELPVPIHGVQLVGGVDVDLDGVPELLVRGEDRPEVWALGAGSERLPLRVYDAVGPGDVPSSASGPLGESWARAEEVAVLGGGRIAGAYLSRAAREAVAQPERGLAMRRAVELASGAGAWQDAAAYALEVAAWPEADPRADLLAAADALEKAHDEVGALEALGQIPRGGDPALVTSVAARERRLRAWVDRPSVVESFDTPWMREWLVDDLLAVRRNVPRSSLRVEVASGQPVRTLARLPVQLTGDSLSLRLDLDVARLEWAMGLDLVLELPSGGVLGLGVMSSGGGGQLAVEAGCVLGSFRPLGVLVPQPSPNGQHRVVMRLEASWDEKRVWCDTRIDDSTDVRTQTFDESPPIGANAWLSLRSRGWAPTMAFGHSEVEVRGLEARGVRPRSAPAESSEVGRRLVEGRVVEAAQLLAPSSSVAAPLYLEAGRVADARAALARSFDPSGPLPAMVVEAVRLDPDRWTALLGEVLPEPSFYRAVRQAWSGTALMHGHVGEPELDRFFSTQLDGLDTVQPVDGAAAADVVALLAMRASVWRQRSQYAQASADLERAISLAERADVTPDERAELHLEVACLASLMAEAERAFDELERALDLSSSAVLFRDRLEVRPELAGLRDQPRWAALMHPVER